MTGFVKNSRHSSTAPIGEAPPQGREKNLGA